MSGRLVLCGTPIGNLDDISQRALDALTEADVVACEDTRRTLKLLTHFGIRARSLVSYHEGNELDISVEGEKVILQKRRDVCLFCSADDPQIEYKGRRVCENCAGELGTMGRIEVRLPDDTPVSSS